MQEDIVVVSDDSAVGSDTAKELAELKMMLRKQDAEMEKLRTQLAATEIEKRKEEVIPDLSSEEIEPFLKKERVTVWMKDMSEVLKNYVAAVPNPCRPTDVGGRQGQQLSLGVWTFVQGHVHLKARHQQPVTGTHQSTQKVFINGKIL